MEGCSQQWSAFGAAQAAWELSVDASAGAAPPAARMQRAASAPVQQLPVCGPQATFWEPVQADQRQALMARMQAQQHALKRQRAEQDEWCHAVAALLRQPARDAGALAAATCRRRGAPPLPPPPRCAPVPAPAPAPLQTAGEALSPALLASSFDARAQQAHSEGPAPLAAQQHSAPATSRRRVLQRAAPPLPPLGLEQRSAPAAPLQMRRAASAAVPLPTWQEEAAPLAQQAQRSTSEELAALSRLIDGLRAEVAVLEMQKAELALAKELAAGAAQQHSRQVQQAQQARREWERRRLQWQAAEAAQQARNAQQQQQVQQLLAAQQAEASPASISSEDLSWGLGLGQGGALAPSPGAPAPITPPSPAATAQPEALDAQMSFDTQDLMDAANALGLGDDGAEGPTFAAADSSACWSGSGGGWAPQPQPQPAAAPPTAPPAAPAAAQQQPWEAASPFSALSDAPFFGSPLPLSPAPELPSRAHSSSVALSSGLMQQEQQLDWRAAASVFLQPQQQQEQPPQPAGASLPSRAHSLWM